jgi:hypothetical protein
MRAYQNPFLLLLLTSVLVASAACQKKEAASQQAAKVETATPELQPVAGGSTPAVETKYFRGSIGSALGLQMKLRREGEKLSGSYFYQKIGTRIDLKGTIDNDGNLTLQEFDASGKQTGVFRGFWKTDNEDGVISISGNWTKPAGEKKTAFSLHQEPIEFSSQVEIVAKQIKEANKKLNYKIDVDYPQLTGSTDPNVDKFNQYAKALVIKEVSEFRKAMAAETDEEIPSETGSDLGIGYTVTIAKDDLMSIEFDSGSYYRGAAHPNSHSQVVNYDLKNGKPLRLADLFKPGSKYLQTIATYCINDLKKQSKLKGADSMLDNSTIESGASADPKNYQSWTITRKGLGINFDSYQVAPYVAGPQYVLVPYSALKDIIKPDGPITQFVK